MSLFAHKIRLNPTPTQEVYFRRACGAARFVWNWALAEWERQYKEDEKPNGRKLRKGFNAIKYKAFPWLKEMARDTHSQPFTYLDRAFKRFFAGKAEHPKFKKKSNGRDSFYMANEKFKVEGKRIRIPRLGWVKMREELRLKGKIMSATVSRRADHWYVSITVEGDFHRLRTGDGTVGVDVGIKHAAVLSTGEKSRGRSRSRRRSAA